MDDETIIRGRPKVTKLPDRPDPSAFDDDDDDDKTQIRRAQSARRGDDETVVPAKAAGLMGWLITSSGMRRGQVQPIGDDQIIGRDPERADIVIADDRMSGVHARFRIEDEAFVVWDAGSANGTFVNGKRIREATRLAENDGLQMGNARFVLKTLQPEDAGF